jgi:universal stress protein A
VPGLKVKKILLATDFSTCSQKAFRYAVSLARHFKAEVVLAHILEPPPPQVAVMEATFIDMTPHEDMSEQLEEWRRQAAAQQVDATAVVRDGINPHKEITKLAREAGVDMIIIGNHGRNALGRVFMGNTAERVVRFAPCPVLVIRDYEHDFLEEPEARATQHEPAHDAAPH